MLNRQCERLAMRSNEEIKRHGVKNVSFIELCHELRVASDKEQVSECLKLRFIELF